MTAGYIKEAIARTLKASLEPDQRITKIEKIKGDTLNPTYKIQISSPQGIHSIISKSYLDLDKVKLPETYREWLILTTVPLEGLERAKRAFSALAYLHKKGVKVPRPIALDETHYMVIEEFIEGPNLRELTGKNSEADEILMRALAKWFISLHKAYAPKTETSFLKLDYIHVTLDFLSKMAVSKTLIEKLHSLLNGDKTIFYDTLVMLKSDSSIKHFILSKSNLYGVDFEFCGYGDPANDISEACASILMGNLLQKSMSEHNLQLCNVLIQEYAKQGFDLGDHLSTLVAASLIIHAFWTPQMKEPFLRWATEILRGKFDRILSP